MARNDAREVERQYYEFKRRMDQKKAASPASAAPAPKKAVPARKASHKPITDQAEDKSIQPDTACQLEAIETEIPVAPVQEEPAAAVDSVGMPAEEYAEATEEAPEDTELEEAPDADAFDGEDVDISFKEEDDEAYVDEDDDPTYEEDEDGEAEGGFMGGIRGFMQGLSGFAASLGSRLRPGKRADDAGDEDEEYDEPSDEEIARAFDESDLPDDDEADAGFDEPVPAGLTAEETLPAEEAPEAEDVFASAPEDESDDGEENTLPEGDASNEDTPAEDGALDKNDASFVDEDDYEDEDNGEPAGEGLLSRLMGLLKLRRAPKDEEDDDSDFDEDYDAADEPDDEDEPEAEEPGVEEPEVEAGSEAESAEKTAEEEIEDDSPEDAPDAAPETGESEAQEILATFDEDDEAFEDGDEFEDVIDGDDSFEILYGADAEESEPIAENEETPSAPIEENHVQDTQEQEGEITTMDNNNQKSMTEQMAEGLSDTPTLSRRERRMLAEAAEAKKPAAARKISDDLDRLDDPDEDEDPTQEYKLVRAPKDAVKKTPVAPPDDDEDDEEEDEIDERAARKAARKAKKNARKRPVYDEEDEEEEEEDFDYDEDDDDDYDDDDDEEEISLGRRILGFIKGLLALIVILLLAVLALRMAESSGRLDLSPIRDRLSDSLPVINTIFPEPAAEDGNSLPVEPTETPAAN